MLKEKAFYVSVSALLYATALFLPSYRYDYSDYYGWECISNGILTFDDISKNPLPFISWLSNLPFYTGFVILLFSKTRKGFGFALTFSLISFLMSLGVLSQFINMLTGSGIWIAAQFILFIGAWHIRNRASRKNNS